MILEKGDQGFQRDTISLIRPINSSFWGSLKSGMKDFGRELKEQIGNATESINDANNEINEMFSNEPTLRRKRHYDIPFSPAKSGKRLTYIQRVGNDIIKSIKLKNKFDTAVIDWDQYNLFKMNPSNPSFSETKIQIDIMAEKTYQLKWTGFVPIDTKDFVDTDLRITLLFGNEVEVFLTYFYDRAEIQIKSKTMINSMIQDIENIIKRNNSLYTSFSLNDPKYLNQ